MDKYVELSELAVKYAERRFAAKHRAQARIKQIVGGYASFLNAPTKEIKWWRLDGHLDITGDKYDFEESPPVVLGEQGTWHFCFTILLRRSTYGASVNETNRMSYWEVSATIGKVAVDGREFDVYFEEPSSLADLHAHLFDLSKHAMSRPFTEPNKRIGFYD